MTTYNTGDFVNYRATTKIHLGALETNLEKDEIVQFDGTTVIRGGAKDNLPSLRGAVKLGWLVVDTDTTTTYTPKASGVKVHKAINTGNTQEEITINTVVADEREVTSTVTKKATTTVGDYNDGKVVARFKTSPKSNSIRVDKVTDTTIQSIDNSTIKIEKVATPTGDVDVAMAGDTLEEILPQASSTGTPKLATTTVNTNETQIKVDMLKAFVPTFDYDLTADLSTKVDTIMAHADNDVVLNTVLSFETEDVVTAVTQVLNNIQEDTDSTTNVVDTDDTVETADTFDTLFSDTDDTDIELG